MRLTLNVFGTLLALVGVVWILQGIDVLPGSFMTGKFEWAIYGAVALAAGVVMLWAARRKRNQSGN